jgi:hypothetical protein
VSERIILLNGPAKGVELALSSPAEHVYVQKDGSGKWAFVRLAMDQRPDAELYVRSTTTEYAWSPRRSKD